MARHDELPVYKATYNLMLSVLRFLKDFTKEYKYSVGDTLKKETMELMTLVDRASTRAEMPLVLEEARERSGTFGFEVVRSGRG